MATSSPLALDVAVPSSALAASTMSIVAGWRSTLSDVLAAAMDYPWAVASVAGSVVVFALVRCCCRCCGNDT